jgi:dipeptidyl aminopeptidase/acylaminoacyl peptidase
MNRSDPQRRPFTADRFSAALNEIGGAARPDYLDDIVTRAQSTRQRPTWTFPERWLPVSTLTARAATVPRTPLRVAALVALLLIALAVGAVLLVGSRQQVPPPFGRAANGLVAYSANGDIYTVDPATGVSRAIVTGSAVDINPRFSRDGTHLAFERKAEGDLGPGFVYVARADGTDPVRMATPAPLDSIFDYEFSPDGTRILISYGVDGASQIGDYGVQPSGSWAVLIAPTDGGTVHSLGIGYPNPDVAWRPPLGHELVFVDNDDGSAWCCAIHLVSADGGTPQTILGPRPNRSRSHLSWSPDGSRIAFDEWDNSAATWTVQPHIINADGTGERTLPSPPGATWQAFESWSNDGARVLVFRGYHEDQTGAQPVVIPVDGGGPEVPISVPGVTFSPTEPHTWEWAPDDSYILGTPDGGSAALPQVMLDPVAGTSKTLPWTTVSLPSTQRDAP